MGAMSLGVNTAETGGVAWWAHIGGFAAGIVHVRLLGGGRPQPTAARDDWRDQGRRASAHHPVARSHRCWICPTTLAGW